jgi:geranylgeranyl pyrophosphate synthase
MAQQSLRQFFEFQWQDFLARNYVCSTDFSSACLYALEGPGKRVRPLLTLMTADLGGGSLRAALPAAIAIEMIHTYSLVHDDLPSMDNDDYRRGRATVHRVYDEAMAVLVGDALLTDAFRVISDPDFCFDARFLSSDQIAKQIQLLSFAAGGQGMVDGQAMDIAFSKNKTIEQLDTIHVYKTGKLLGAALGLGGIAANVTDVKGLIEAGQQIGLAFQIVDDILDTSAVTGKTPGKDAAAGKMTYLSFMSQQEAMSKAMELTDSAIQRLRSILGRIDDLEQFLRQLIFRRS